MVDKLMFYILNTILLAIKNKLYAYLYTYTYYLFHIEYISSLFIPQNLHLLQLNCLLSPLPMSNLFTLVSALHR